MSILKTILDTIWKHPVAQQPQPAPTSAPGGPPSERRVPRDAAPPSPEPRPATASPAKSPVDIDAVMSALAKERGGPLDWKNSVVDLLKTVGLDSSHDARVRLAHELHFTGDVKDSVSMNEFLHDAVLKAIEDNGGKLPEDLK